MAHTVTPLHPDPHAEQTLGPLSRYQRVGHAEAFGPQPTSTIDLPEPRDFTLRLVGGIIECVHGVREPGQFARWMTEDVYRAIAARARKVSVAQQQQRRAAERPMFSLGNAVMSSPRDGVVEASVVVHASPRVRAVAIRLEGYDYRWKATSFSML